MEEDFHHAVKTCVHIKYANHINLALQLLKCAILCTETKHCVICLYMAMEACCGGGGGG